MRLCEVTNMHGKVYSVGPWENKGGIEIEEKFTFDRDIVVTTVEDWRCFGTANQFLRTP